MAVRRIQQRVNDLSFDEIKAREVRRDKGRIMRTERDEWVLTWIGEMMVVRLDQLQRLLGRDPQATTRAPGTVGPTTAKDVVRRWLKDGLVENRVIYHKKPAFIWLTSKGQRSVGLPYKNPFSGKTDRLRHYYYVAQARLYLEEKWGSDIRWVSERRLVARKEMIQGHYPDGLVYKQGDNENFVIPIETELSDKSEERTVQILTNLAESYDNVAYFVVKATYNSVQKRINMLSPNDKDAFQLIELEETF